MLAKNLQWTWVRFVLALILVIILFGGIPAQGKAMQQAALTPPGSLDASFDGDGLVTTSVGAYGDDEGSSIVLQPDGKIIVAGWSAVPYGTGWDRDFSVVRYNSDGSLDPSFDTDGKVTLDLGNHYQDYGRAAVIQLDGKIVVAGYSDLDGLESNLALARFNSNGSLDTSFDTDGKVITDLGPGYDVIDDMVLQQDGKILVVGYKPIDVAMNVYNIAVVRYNTNGSLDASFGANGIVITSVTGGGDFGMSIALQPDNKIIVGSFAAGNLAVLRYNSNGSLDNSFDGDGILRQSGNGRGGSVALQADGKILIAGYGDYDNAILARYNTNGSPDTSFGSGGATTAFLATRAQILSIAIQPNGKIVLAGSGEVPYNFVLVRFSSNGSLDYSFDTDGKVITDFGDHQDDLANDVAIQPDGKIILAGYRYTGSVYNLALARYVGEGNILHVNSNAKGANNGTSWADAYTSLQSALTAAVKGDQVWVAAGTYKPTTGTDHSASFVLKNDVAIYGGFAGTENYLIDRDYIGNVTVISGDIGAAGNISDNSYHVVNGSGTNNSAILDGFTVVGGNANGSSPNDKGGGIYIYEGAPTIENVIVMNNSATFGGGMYNGGDSSLMTDGSSPILTNVTFSGNSATEGGGMENQYRSSPTLNNVSFSGNTAVRSGGGMLNFEQSSPGLKNVYFEHNIAAMGGGMANWNGNSSVMENISFTGNSAEFGGGMGNYSSSPTLKDVTFNGNTATSSSTTAYGGGMSNEGYSHPILQNVDFTGNTAVKGGGMSNMQSNPALTDVIFGNNSASGVGGGMSNEDYSNPTLTNVTFRGNTAKDPVSGYAYGGGMANYQSSPVITNVTFFNNSAYDGGGIVNRDAASNPILTNVTFNKNSANAKGGAISNDGSMTIRNSIFWENSGGEIFNLGLNGAPAVVTYSTVKGGYTGTGNLSSDPLLETLHDNGGYTPTLALGASSPAIDAGTNANCPASDQRGTARPQGAHCDMGAYEVSSALKVVSKLADTNDGVCNVDCSLREAISTSAQGDTIKFGLSGTIILGSALPAINKTMVIDGSGQSITLDGAKHYRIFNVGEMGDLTVKKLTFQNGGPATPCEYDTTFSSCGGALYADGILTVIDSTFSSNTASMGGAVAVMLGRANIEGSTFASNSSAKSGGAIFNLAGLVSVENSTFYGNAAGDWGGGILNDIGSLTLNNNTFSNNSASLGAGIYNSAGDLVFANNILANSTGGGDCYNESPYGQISLNASNLIEANAASPNDCGTPSTTADPKLGPLADNGGFTQTMVIQPGSPAIDSGNDVECSATDQRGVPRPQGSHCDIGAYEYDMVMISGSAGAAGAVLQYTNREPKTVTADASGNYSLFVPKGWNGMVTPYKAGYSFTPPNRSYGNLQSSQSGQNYTAQACASCADVNMAMETTGLGSYSLPTGMAISNFYEGLAGGPVLVQSTNGMKIFASEHRNYQTSFSESLGFPNDQLTTKYWFTRYAANANVKTWILVTNPDPNQDADVNIYIGDLTNAHESFTLPAGTAVSKYYEGLAGGPVVVESTNGVKIFTSEHRNYQTSFSETLGFPDNQLTTKYWFTRYAYNANVKTWILVTNTDLHQDANVKVYIGDLTNAVDAFTLPAGTALALPPHVELAGGPVVVESTNGVKIFASEHRNYQTSFSESLGFPDNQLTTKYWFTRYAYNANVKTWILVTNPDPNLAANVKVYIGDLTNAVDTFTLPAGTAIALPPHDGLAGGPVVVESTNGVKIFASEHRNYQTSFSESLGFPDNQLTTKYWFTRYAYNANVKTWILVTNP
jgi:uncharacterized delta-60 repeat protein/CSLREA domain-containing protein